MFSIVKKITALFLAVFAASCAGKNVFSPCLVTGAEFSKAGITGVSLRFADVGSCDYRIIKETGTDWTIELASGSFGDFRPAMDRFSSGALLSASAEGNRYRLVFHKDTEVSSAKEGSRTVFIMKGPSASGPGAASRVTSAVCSPGGVPFLLKVNSDGAAAYEMGQISSGKGYLDIFGVFLSDDFSLSPVCSGFVSVSEASFPERVRFIISDPLIASMKASGDGASVSVSRAAGAGQLHILKVLDGRKGAVQTVKIYTSSAVEPKVEGLTGGGISVSLGKWARPVSGLPKVTMLSGPAFSSMRIEEGGKETVLLFKSPVPAVDVDVYAEKTGYGFVVYARKLR